MSYIFDDLYEMQSRRKDTKEAKVMSRKTVVKKSYEEILKIIREEISTNHATELSEVISDPRGRDVLKTLITQYINQNQVVCDSIDNFNELLGKIFEDMAGFGFLTQYIYDPDLEEININAWNDVEVVFPEDKGGYRKLNESFLSPQQAMDMVKKMCAYGGIVIDGAQPVKDSFIFKGVRISASIYPVVDKDIGVCASIRRQKTTKITREELLATNTALPVL